MNAMCTQRHNTHVLIKHSVLLNSYQHIIPCHELFSFHESLRKDNHPDDIYAMSRDRSCHVDEINI